MVDVIESKPTRGSIPADRLVYRTNMRRARDRAGLSLDRLVQLTGVAKQTLHQMERPPVGHMPTQRSMSAVAAALGVPLGSLFWFEKARAPDAEGGS